MEQNRDFDRSKVRLPEFRVEVWNDLIWVNLDDDAEPLGPTLVELDEAFSVYRRPDEWFMTNHYYKDWVGNWKHMVENNLEGYHHMGIHQGSIETYSPTSNTTNLTHGENWTRHQVPYDLDLQVARDRIEQTNWQPGNMGQTEAALDVIHIHPGNSFVIYPGGVGFYTIWPISHDLYRYRSGSIRAPGEIRRLDPEGEAYDSERSLDEDAYAMPYILQGANSSKAMRGSLSWMEVSVLRWYQWIARRVLDGARDVVAVADCSGRPEP